jgi:thiol-disulfide isomerase/thioredoxin
MSEVEPAAEGAESQGSSSARPVRRGPRKRFLVIGVVLAAALGVGLFTSVGTSQGTPGSGSSGSGSGGPYAGGPVPGFTAPNVGPVGGSQVSVPGDGGSGGTPAVLLFFGNWCPSCHQELPPLAAEVRQGAAAGGSLARIHVIGVDSEDSRSSAQSFIRSSGVTFPVAYDPDISITSGLFYFTGDPYAVFVRGNGTIDRIVRGDVLTPSSLVADERALIPSGR